MPPNAWGLPKGKPEVPAAPSQSAFPDLAAAQRVTSTRRTRSAARALWASDEPGAPSSLQRTRVDELNSRATQWRRNGRVARDIAFREDYPARSEQDAPNVTLEEEERGASIASIRIQDRSKGSALGAWASLFQAPADPLRTTYPEHERAPKQAELLSDDSTYHTVHDPAELAECPSVVDLEACLAHCARTHRADALQSQVDTKQAFMPLLHLVETCVASPVMLYRLCANGPLLDDAPLVFLQTCVARLPAEVRDEYRNLVRSSLDTNAVHLAAAQQAADAQKALALYASQAPGIQPKPTACALLSVELCDTDDARLIERLAQAVSLASWQQPADRLAGYETRRLKRLATRISTAISWRLGQYHAARQKARILPSTTDPGLQHLVAMLGHVWTANTLRPRSEQCAVSTFYAAATEIAFGLDEYMQWVHSPTSERGVHWLCDVPCVLSLGTKVQIHAWEARQALRQASTYAWLHAGPSQTRLQITHGLRAAQGLPGPSSADHADQGVLALHVRRTHLVQDSRPLLELDAHELLRPLKVTFDGEIAQDAGGVQKEYLLLLCEMLCSPSMGLFADINEAPLHGVLWFAPSLPMLDDGSSEPLAHLELLGVVLGLALVHSVTLPLSFPCWLYEYLLHAALGTAAPPSDREALSHIRPQLAAGLAQVLGYDERDARPLEDAMHLTWSVQYGEQVYPLAPDQPPVTSANRDAYVARVCQWMLCDAVRVPLAALARGFARIAAPPTAVPRSPLQLLQPVELETLLRGRNERELDVDALRASTAHVGFPAKSSRYADQVQTNLDNFWATWAALDAPAQHALLGFITGSPRVPAMGAASIGLRIQHVDDPYTALGTERVPWSSTCTSTLFLPVYDTRGALEAKVRVALQHSTGFGLG